MLGKLGSYMQKDEVGTFSNHIQIWTKKWIKDPDVKLEIIKFLEENIGRIIFDINYSNDIFDLHPKETRVKINKWGLIKLKLFTIKGTIEKTKRQTAEWEKICINNMPDKGLIYKMYKQLIQLNIKKTNNSIKTWAEDLKRQFSKEEMQK